MFTEKKPGAPRVALVGCSASKLKKSAPARELYTSALFGAAYAYAEKTCDAILVVSAFYGVVAPKVVIRPYDRSLRKYNKSEREQWGVRTVGQLLPSFVLPPLLVILAGKVYADAIAHGAHWHNLPQPELPLTGIRGCGPRVKWLRVERVKAKIAQLPAARRCCADCPTWCVSDTARGFEIQCCDACWQGAPDPLTDDEAALLPDARARLAALEGEPLLDAGAPRRAAQGGVLRGERGRRGDAHRRAPDRQHGERPRVVRRQRESGMSNVSSKRVGSAHLDDAAGGCAISLEETVGRTVARVETGHIAGAYGDEPTVTLHFTDGTHYLAALYEEEEMLPEDWALKRVGSAHVEDIVGGRARCGVCGWIDEADPENPTVRAWHGDSFTEEDLDEGAPAIDEPRGSG